MDRQQITLHVDMHAAAMKCIAVACTGLDEATRALETAGSPGTPAALQLALEALMQSLIRHPLSHILAEVSQSWNRPLDITVWEPHTDYSASLQVLPWYL